jgi:hypothetical protein
VKLDIAVELESAINSVPDAISGSPAEIVGTLSAAVGRAIHRLMPANQRRSDGDIVTTDTRIHFGVDRRPR